MLWFGIILLLAAVGCLWAATRSRRTVHAMTAAETLSVPELLELQGISAELTGPGQFRKVCEVVGETVPAPVGLLRSELAGVDCVWHAHRVQRRYKHYDRDSDGDTRVTTRTETVARSARRTAGRCCATGTPSASTTVGSGPTASRPSSTGSSPRTTTSRRARWPGRSRCSARWPAATATRPSVTSTRSGCCAPARGCTCSARSTTGTGRS
jgi:hypothetical protein